MRRCSSGGRIAEQPSWSLNDHRRALQRRSDVAQLDHAIQNAISGAYDALPPSAQEALRLLASQPCEHLAERQFAALIGTELEEAAETAERLFHLNCASRPAPGRIGVHVIVRQFAQAMSWEEDSQAERDRALSRLACSMLDEAWAATEALYAGSVSRSRNPKRTVRELTGKAGSRWLRTELGHLITVARALAPSEPRHMDELIEAIGRFVHEQTSLPFAETMFREAVENASLLDASARAIANMLLAQTLVSAGDPEALTVLETTRENAREANLPLIEFAALNSTDIIAGRGGDLITSRQVFTEIVDRAQDVPGADLLRAVAMDNAAIVRYRQGELQESVDEHRAAITFGWASTAVPVPVIALAHANLTDPLLAMGDIVGAETAAREAMALAEGRSVKVTLNASRALGLAQLQRGDAHGALSTLRAVKDREHEIAEPSDRATMLLAYGDALAAVGEQDDARHEWGLAHEVAVRASFTYEQARALLRLGRSIAATDPAEAQSLLRRSVELFDQAVGIEASDAREALSDLVESSA